MMSTATATATSPSTSSISPPPVFSNGDGGRPTVRRKLPEGVMGNGSDHNEDSEHQSPSGDPLPPDLRRVLMEVARTGHCSWLSWNNLEGVPASSSAEGAAVSDNNKNATGAGRPFLTSSPYQSTIAPSQSSSLSPLHKVPPRKKRRWNGLHNSSAMGRRRAFAGSESNSRAKSPAGNNVSTTGRKRPLFLIRTTSSSVHSAGSVGSSCGRTSGSEPDDSTHAYECDSEGTSATTNSELSMDRTRKQQQLRQRITIQKKQSSVSASSVGEKSATPRFRTLQEAVRVALALVLDHSYRTRGAYKLSPAEIRSYNGTTTAGQESTRKGQTEGTSATKSVAKGATNTTPVSTEAAFQLRRRRLLALLGEDDMRDDGQSGGPGSSKTHALAVDAGSKGGAAATRTSSFAVHHREGPPFTIQRVAEVLVSPERYYTQTHKLCNCLEKLLLISSPETAFGGSAGGETERSRQEARELAALVYEKGRERRLRKYSFASSDGAPLETHDSPGGSGDDDHSGVSPTGTSSSDDAATGKTDLSPSSPDKADDAEISHDQAVVDAAEKARASLRSKFDHAAIDAHTASAAATADARAIAGQRGMTSSPPPPSLPLSTQNIAMQTQFGSHPAGDSYSDPMAHHHHHHQIVRPPSPILFSSGTDSRTSVNPLSPTNSNMHLLQVHHAAALAGMPTLGRTPLDILIGTSTSAAVNAGDVADLEVEPGRSSASNSDVDSESDDFSLDDSASDRSDGSDSGIGLGTAHYEPFTAARVMTLNRIQQQQRLQSRQPFPSTGSHYQQGDASCPPADSEYQSGDSIDSTRAEDSGGSDSSSSDLAD